MRFLLHPLPQFSTLSADCVNDCAAFQAPFTELAKSFGAEQVAFVNGADDHLSEPLCCSACGGGMALHASNGPPPASQHGHVHRGYCTAEAAPLHPTHPTPHTACLLPHLLPRRCHGHSDQRLGVAGVPRHGVAHFRPCGHPAGCQGAERSRYTRVGRPGSNLLCGVSRTGFPVAWVPQRPHTHLQQRIAFTLLASKATGSWLWRWRCHAHSFCLPRSVALCAGQPDECGPGRLHCGSPLWCDLKDGAGRRTGCMLRGAAAAHSRSCKCDVAVAAILTWVQPRTSWFAFRHVGGPG